MHVYGVYRSSLYIDINSVYTSYVSVFIRKYFLNSSWSRSLSSANILLKALLYCLFASQGLTQTERCLLYLFRLLRDLFTTAKIINEAAAISLCVSIFYIYDSLPIH